MIKLNKFNPSLVFKASKKNQGFSLVELIIVIAIMAILAAAIAPALIRYIDKSRRADDVQVGRIIGEALSLAISSGDEYQSGGDSDDMYSWYMKDLTADVYTVTDENGNNYDLVCIAQWIYGQNGSRFINGGASGHDFLVDEINNTVDPTDVMIKCTKNPKGSTLNTYICGRNKTNDRIEVWIGSTTDNKAYYLLYPETCSDYK
ncbi:MAG: prepilin-type N-terminal cleavage/methylation domain-containing protein [Eubacterium sp.]|nr:prepilin-type N-terminal cleavage/methylation domain-containing protein [Eubacterium sp.]